MPHRRRIIDDRLYAHFVTFSVLLSSKIVKYFTKTRDHREQTFSARAVARIGWRPCRPVYRCRRLPNHDHRKNIVLGVLNAEFRTWYEWRRTVGLPIHWIEEKRKTSRGCATPVQEPVPPARVKPSVPDAPMSFPETK